MGADDTSDESGFNDNDSHPSNIIAKDDKIVGIIDANIHLTQDSAIRRYRVPYAR